MGKRGTKPKFALRPYVYSRTTEKGVVRWSANVRGAYDARTFLGSKFESKDAALAACDAFIKHGTKPKKVLKHPRRVKKAAPRAQKPQRPEALKTPPLERKTGIDWTATKPVSWRDIHKRVYADA